jgi:hypothetical protein
MSRLTVIFEIREYTSVGKTCGDRISNGYDFSQNQERKKEKDAW